MKYIVKDKEGNILSIYFNEDNALLATLLNPIAWDYEAVEIKTHVGGLYL